MEINGLCDNFSLGYSNEFEWKGQFQLWEVVSFFLYFLFFFSPPFSEYLFSKLQNVCWGESGMAQFISVDLIGELSL